MTTQMPDLALVHADEHLLVFDKPSGLLCVPGRGEDKQDCLSARAQQRWPECLVVHRLDMATSGLVLMARSPAMQRALGLAFERRRVHKRYEAVVCGQPVASAQTDGWAEIDLPLIVDWLNRPRSKVDHAIGKPSRTRWQPCGPGPLPQTTRLRLEPLTGRTHQLRVHLMALGHPIVGDPLYAAPDAQAQSQRLLLHACELGFEHPASGQWLQLHSPTPF
jgi:tRNA pseudouridine32 synthase/23S rRNA pseudouridine746 synthase